MSDNIKLLVVGAGNMGREYAKVISSMNLTATFICNSPATTQTFYESTGCHAVDGGLDNWLENNQLDHTWRVIVATPVEVLASNLKSLLYSGAKDILVEKPGFIYLSDGEELAQMIKAQGAKVWVAYNRRFYSSVLAAEKIIAEDGGLSSIQYEFTEWGFKIEPLKKGQGVKERWFLGNSTHVVDLAFFLSGIPQKYHFYTSGALDWHPSASIFVGAGITDRGIPFSYSSNWGAPGRWGIEMMTPAHRLYLRPMESLQIQKIGSVQVQPFEIEDSLDKQFKPGLYQMVHAFLKRDESRLPRFESQLAHFKIFCEMANYPS